MAVAVVAQVSSAPSLGSNDQPPVFKSKVNLIVAPVVVRDKKGNTIATLHQEHFQLFDNGKLQVDRLDIGGAPYILPVRSETEVEGPQLAIKNAIAFRAFGKFGASSTVDVGVPK